MAHPKHQQVRQRYSYCCGYCGVSEIDTGGELTVDHYQPLSSGGSNEEENLVYSCIRCNQYKGDYWPDRAALEKGKRVLHPQRDRSEEYFFENHNNLLEALTETGRFHIELLELNRLPLVLHRERKRAIKMQVAQQDSLLVLITAQQQMLAEMRAYLRLIRQSKESQQEEDTNVSGTDE